MKNQKGFSLVEGLLILVIVGMIGGIGWYVWDSNSKTNKSLTNADAANGSVASYPKKTSFQKTGPYAGWKTYTTKYEKLSFKYPSSWTLKDNSKSTGNDKLTLSANSSFRIIMEFGYFPGIDWGGYNIANDDVTFLGKPAKLGFATDLGSDNREQVAVIILESNNGTILYTKNVVIPPSGQSDKGLINLSIWFGPTDIDNIVTKPLKIVQADENYKNAKLVIQSMTY